MSYAICEHITIPSWIHSEFILNKNKINIHIFTATTIEQLFMYFHIKKVMMLGNVGHLNDFQRIKKLYYISIAISDAFLLTKFKYHLRH